MLISWLIIIFISFFISTSKTEKATWSRSLSHTISQKIEPYQVMVLCQGNGSRYQSRIDELILEIGKGAPVFKVQLEKRNLIESILQDLKTLPAFLNPRASTLFIATRVSENNHESSNIRTDLLEQKNFIARLSGARIRPKVLILHLTVNKGFIYKNLLSQLWLQRFLDVSVLQVIILKSTKLLVFEDYQEIPTLHYWNPFTGVYTKKKFASRTKLFPQKLWDLKGLEMKVGVSNYPPFITVTRNVSGYPVSVEGPEIELAKALSEKLNFKIVYVISEDSERGEFYFNKEETTGLYYMLTHNEIQFLAKNIFMLDSRELAILERSSFTRYGEGRALVPINFSKNSPHVEITTNFIKAIILLVGLMLLNWIISRSLKFDNRFWQPMSIVQLVFGSSVPREPEKLHERIVFFSTLLSGIIYTSWVYLAITEITLTSRQENELSVINDLVHSNLTTSISKVADPTVLKDIGTDALIKLLEKHVVMTTEECVKMLKKYKNVTCLMYDFVARRMMQNHREEYSQPLMKMIEQKLLKSLLVLKMEPESPYVERFNMLLLEFKDAGIMNKWFEFIKEWSRLTLHPQKFIGTVNVKWQLVYILSFGYTISFLAFIAEVIVGRLMT